MNFIELAAASTREVEAYVRHHNVGGNTATSFVALITEYAGLEETSRALQCILLKMEADFGDQHFFAGFTYQSRGSTRDSCIIHGSQVAVWFAGDKPWNQDVFLPGDRISCGMGKTFTKNGRVNVGQILAEFTVAEWNFESRRALLIEALLIYYHNNCCKFCDGLLQNLEDTVCSDCWRIIGPRCSICEGEVGETEFGRVKRGLPKVHYHQGCAKRQRTQ